MKTKEQIIEEIADHVKAIIELLGEDPMREGLQKTPIRNAKALYSITNGYREDAQAVIKQAIFEYSGSKMIVVKDIEFYSMCEHHILPFFGKVSIGYLPKGEMVGLSKLARVVNVYARRLQVQERMTSEIMNAITESLSTDGVIVMCSAQHLCMKMRGVEKQDASTTTIDYNGKFESDASLREEFLRYCSSALS